MKKRMLLNMCLLGGSIAVTFLLLEMALRIYTTGWKNLITVNAGAGLVNRFFQGMLVYDEFLGWSPAPNSSGNVWNTTVHILEHGVRSNGRAFVSENKFRVLAIGDSFTFGDEVADHETWPAMLESLLQAQVINGGVPSYGFDQMILRAEQLLEIYTPDLLIISIIYEDIDRCGQSVRQGTPKPYFLVENRQLVLQNSPAPKKSQTQLDLFRNIFGHSYVVHHTMDRLLPRYWWAGTMRDTRPVNNQPIEVVSLLIDRLCARLRAKNIPAIFLVQGTQYVEDDQQFIRTLLPRIESRLISNQIDLVNLVPRLHDIEQKDPERFFTLFHHDGLMVHMTPEGNRFVAQQLHPFIMAASSVYRAPRHHASGRGD